MTKTIRVQRRDRPWVDAWLSVLCGPFEMPSIDTLRQAVTALAEKYPHSRLTWRLDATKRYWRNERTAESIVVEREFDDSLDVGAHLDAIARDESLDPPLTLIRYPHYLGMKMSHGMGDGRYFVAIITAVLHTAFMGAVVPWPGQPAGRFPLIEAALRTYGKNPALFLDAVKDRPRHIPESTPSGTRPWSPSRRTLHVTIPSDQAAEIFRWGEEFAPGASHAAIRMTLILRAMERVGMRISSDVRIVADLRRYLGWRFIDGNFIAGVSTNISADMNPVQVSSLIKRTNKSGRPLAGQILTNLHGFAAMPEIDEVDTGGVPRVTVTDLGASPAIDSLPFIPDAPPVYTGSIPTEGPLGLTVLTGEISRMSGFVITFHDNVIDPSLLGDAMKLTTEDPIGLLAG
jgi:hypothetical protein